MYPKCNQISLVSYYFKWTINKHHVTPILVLNYFSFAIEQTYTFLRNFNISRGMNLDMIDQEQEGSGTKTNG